MQRSPAHVDASWNRRSTRSGRAIRSAAAAAAAAATVATRSSSRHKRRTPTGDDDADAEYDFDQHANIYMQQQQQQQPVHSRTSKGSAMHSGFRDVLEAVGLSDANIAESAASGAGAQHGSVAKQLVTALQSVLAHRQARREKVGDHNPHEQVCRAYGAFGPACKNCRHFFRRRHAGRTTASTQPLRYKLCRLLGMNYEASKEHAAGHTQSEAVSAAWPKHICLVEHLQHLYISGSTTAQARACLSVVASMLLPADQRRAVPKAAAAKTSKSVLDRSKLVVRLPSTWGVLAMPAAAHDAVVAPVASVDDVIFSNCPLDSPPTSPWRAASYSRRSNSIDSADSTGADRTVMAAAGRLAEEAAAAAATASHFLDWGTAVAAMAAVPRANSSSSSTSTSNSRNSGSGYRGEAATTSNPQHPKRQRRVASGARRTASMTPELLMRMQMQMSPSMFGSGVAAPAPATVPAPAASTGASGARGARVHGGYDPAATCASPSSSASTGSAASAASASSWAMPVQLPAAGSASTATGASSCSGAADCGPTATAAATAVAVPLLQIDATDSAFGQSGDWIDHDMLDVSSFLMEVGDAF